MYVTATGLVCPVGSTTEAACAAMRAGISAFVELPYCDDSGEAIVGATVPDLEAKMGSNDRLIELLARAIAECIDHHDPGDPAKIPLFVGLAESQRPGRYATPGSRIILEVEQRLGVRFLRGQSRVIMSGRTAGFEALKRARDLMLSEHLPRCLICGVDSYLNSCSLDWLNEHWRLKNQENSDGIIPGEAAAAVMIQDHPGPASSSQASVTGLGFATEKATVLNEDPPLFGLGLTGASRAALSEAGIQMHEIGFRVSDITGESYGFKEQSLMLGRLLRVHREEDYPIWHCAENIGDTGAAAAVVGLVTAFHALEKGYAPGTIAMCFACGDRGKRAVAILASNPTGRPEV